MKNAWLALCCAVLMGAAPPDPKETGPVTLVITYRCTPVQRVQLRDQMIQTGLRRFEQWRSSGILANYHVLFSRYTDTNNWDMLAVLTFTRYSDLVAWKRVEKTAPGGLTPDILEFTSAVSTYPVDLMRENTSKTTAVEPVFLVVPYTYSVAAPAYLTYVDDYVKPQFEGWLEEGILAKYSIFLQRYSASRPWDSLIILEYKDDESLGAREKIVAKVRQRLQSNPAWKAISDNKQSIRIEKEAIIADELSYRDR